MKNPKKWDRPTVFIWGMVAGMILLFVTQYSGIMGDFWDIVKFGETDVIECADMQKFYEENHLQPHWDQEDQLIYEYGMLKCK